MFKHRMEIVHNHGNGYRDWLFYQDVFPQRDSTSIMSFNGKGFRIEGLFKPDFHSHLSPVVDAIFRWRKISR